MIRTFIAIEIPDFIREEIAELQESLKKRRLPVRWVPPENIHLTLKFIGEIPQETVNAVRETIFEAEPMAAPFEVAVGGTGAFPNANRPRVVWTGITSGGETLRRLAEEIDTRTAAFGIPREKRAFRPHLTIGRIKDPRSVQGLGGILSPGVPEERSFTVDRITFMQSALLPSGAKYTPLAVLTLA